jgi:serine phosphatase RsbU (regulator of sigma subunit)
MELAEVLRAAQTADPAAVVDHLAAAVRDFGGTDVVIYLVDFDQVFLEPLPDRSSHAERAREEEVATTMAGRSFLTRTAVTAERPEGTRVWVPVMEGSDRTGVLAMTVESGDEATIAECVDAGILAGYLIAAHARCTDLYQLHRRRRSMSLAASMQWDLLPPLVMHARSCQVAARLEPAYSVGGDCFDYALNGDVLDVALIDAMGHGVGSSSIASLAVGCYRHGRREGHRLEVVHAAINEIIERQFTDAVFATGQLAQLEVGTGVLTWTNAGHPRPLLVRNGQVVRQLLGESGLPWGLDFLPVTLNREALEPGDAVLFFTDGVTEARTPDGEEFGLERLIDLVGRFASEVVAPEEMVRRLVGNVVEHRAADLRDDATVVLVEWAGPGH